MLATVSPFPQYFDTAGRPLDGGYLYFGVANDNPETSPITVYWDAAGTQPASQPIRTVNGYPVRAGTPSLVYTAAEDYSMTVRDQKRRQVIYAASSQSFDGLRNLRNDLASTAAGKGADLSGLSGGVNYAVRTVGWQATQEVHVGLFSGYDPTPGADNTAVLAAAHAWADALPYGATLVIPRGYMKVSALPTLAANVNWRGYGRLASQIEYTGTGDGLKYSGAINTYDPLRITLRDFTLYCTNASNVGGGLVLESCAYVGVSNAYFQGFKYGHIHDGDSHFRCEYTELAQQLTGAIWIVNGSERRAGQNKLFSNNIWYGTEIQINLVKTAGRYALIDDGGVNHDYCGINFNAGDVGARVAGVVGLRYHNNAHESYIQSPLVFEDTSLSGVYVGPCSAFDVRGNTLSNISAFEIVVNACGPGVIEANVLGQMTTSGFSFGSSSRIRGLKIGRNSKLVTGAGRTAAPFFGVSLTSAVAPCVDVVEQMAQTYVSSALGATGSQTVTPASIEGISVGKQLIVQNEDGSNAELVTVTATSGGTFTATFASTKAANWTVAGQASRVTSGTWTPTIAGTSTAGANTYTTQAGWWTMREDGSVHVQGMLVMSAKDGAMAGNLVIGNLPFRVANTANRQQAASITAWDGFTFPANYTALTGFAEAGQSRIGLRRSGSGQTVAVPQPSELGASATIVFECTYFPG